MGIKDKKKEVDITKYKNIYVMSDIHGHYEEFMKMLDKINFNYKEDLLIVNGDTIDRGYANLDVLEFCLTHDNIILLMGNHELMMCSLFSEDNEIFNCWINNGGYKTYRELMEKRSDDLGGFRFILAKVKNLPYYMEINLNGEKFLIVHAGIIASTFSDNVDELMSIQGDNIFWTREQFLKAKENNSFKIIFGHTPTYLINYEKTGDFPDYYSYKGYDEKKIKEDARNAKIYKEGQKIGIDCGLYSGGKLGCLRLNDMSEFYVDKIEQNIHEEVEEGIS